MSENTEIEAVQNIHNPNPTGKRAKRASIIVKRAWKAAGKPDTLKVWARKTSAPASEKWFANKA